MQLVCDLLSDINKDLNVLKQHSENTYLRNLFKYALLSEYKFLLPEGAPPFKTNQQSSAQLHGSMWGACKKLYIFARPDMKQLQRESLFVTTLESVSAEEATLLIAIKDQTLDQIYPNLNYDNINQTNPGWLS
jgi:hypothetical protein